MLVAKSAAWAAVIIAAIGILMGFAAGDVFLLAAGVSTLFVAALFWTLAEIGTCIGEGPSPSPSATQPQAVTEDEKHESRAPTGSLEELERKLASKRT